MTATQVRRIDEVAVVFNGKTPSKSEQRGSGHPVLKIKDIDELGRFRGTFSGHVGVDLAQKHVKQQLAGGETLVLNAAHSVTHVASKTFYADQEVAGSLATGEWLIVRWSTETVDSRFGNHWINAPDTRFRIRHLVKGIHLYPKDVARLQIPLPPLAEQKRIAGILDAADALRAKRRKALAQLDTLLQSTFLDMFGDPVTNPMGWEKPPLEDLCDKVIDCPHSTPRWSGSGVICLRTSNLGKGEWNWADTRFVIEEDYTERTRRSEILPNDIILSREGTVGVLALVDEGMRLCMGQRLVQLRVNDSQLDPRFLLNLLLHDLAPERLSRLIAGSTSKHLNVKELRKLPVLLPPLDLQHRFAAIVQSVEHQKASQRAHQAELDTLFASLQSRRLPGSPLSRYGSL